MRAAPALSWDAPDACPGAAWVRARIAHYLGADQVDGRDTTLRAEVHVERRRGLFVARTELRFASGAHTRHLRDPDCVTVADAVAFIVAQAVDPRVTAPQPLTAEERAKASGPATGQPGGDRPATAGNRRRTGDGAGAASSDARGSATPGSSAGSGGANHAAQGDPRTEPVLLSTGAPDIRGNGGPLTLGYAVGVGVELSGTPLPGTAPAAQLRVAARFGRRFRLGLRAGYAPPVVHARSPTTGARVAFGRAFLGLTACAMSEVASAAQLQLGLCTGLQGGLIHANASRLSAGVDRTLADAAARVALAGFIPVGADVALSAELGAAAPILRARFVTNGDQILHEAEKVGIFAVWSAELRFD